MSQVKLKEAGKKLKAAKSRRKQQSKTSICIQMVKTATEEDTSQ